MEANCFRTWARALVSAATVAAIAGTSLAAVPPASAATTGTLLYSTDGGTTWSPSPTVAPGATVLVRAWYDNSDTTPHAASSISTTLPPGYTLVPGSTVVCLNPLTPAGSEATPNTTEQVCNTTAGQSGAINEGAVWSGSTLTIAPTAGLFGQSTGLTSGIMEIGKKRYFNLQQCTTTGNTSGAPLQQRLTNLLSTLSRPQWSAGTNMSNTAGGATATCSGDFADAGNSGNQALDLLGRRYFNLQQCNYFTTSPNTVASVLGANGNPGTRTGTNTSNTPAGATATCAGTPIATESGAQALDLLGNRYVNLQQCNYLNNGQNRVFNVLGANGNPARRSGTNASNTPTGTAPNCAAGFDTGFSGSQAFDTLDTTRGAGYVQFAITAPAPACPSTASTATQTETVTGTGVTATPSTGTLTTTTASCHLTIVKTASPAGPVRPGQVVTYRVTVTNPGTVPYTGATFTDDLAGVLNAATLTGTPTATSGTATVTGSTLTWTGNVPAGGTATVTYQVTVS